MEWRVGMGGEDKGQGWISDPHLKLDLGSPPQTPPVNLYKSQHPTLFIPSHWLMQAAATREAVVWVGGYVLVGCGCVRRIPSSAASEGAAQPVVVGGRPADGRMEKRPQRAI